MYDNVNIADTMINAVFMQLFCTFNAALVYSHMFKIKSKWKLFLMTVPKLFIFNLVVTYLRCTKGADVDFGIKFYIANVVAMFAYIFILKLCTKERYSYIFMSNFLIDLTVSAVMCIPWFFILKCYGEDVPLLVGEGKKPFGICVFIIILCVASLSTFLLNKFHKFLSSKIENKKIIYSKWWYVVFLCELTVGSVGYAEDKIFENTKIIIYMLLMYSAGIGFLYITSVISRRIQDKKLREENQVLLIENTVMKEYYLTLQYQMEKTRKFRHDIEKHMLAMQEMVDEENNSEKLEVYAMNLNNEYANLLVVEYCKNPIINAILVNKKRICDENNIDFDIDVSEVNIEDIKEIDLVAVMANVLDVAIEQTGKFNSEEKYIKFRLGSYAGNLVMSVEYPGEAVKTELVKDIAKRYDGTVEYKTNTDNAEIVLVLPNLHIVEV